MDRAVATIIPRARRFQRESPRKLMELPEVGVAGASFIRLADGCTA